MLKTNRKKAAHSENFPTEVIQNNASEKIASLEEHEDFRPTSLTIPQSETGKGITNNLADNSADPVQYAYTKGVDSTEALVGAVIEKSY